MLNLNYFSLLLNKTVVVLATISLLVTTFVFPIEENVKQEFSILYNATSICEYYNSLTNLSYGIINKVLKSANINLSYTSTKTETTKNKKTNKKHNRFDFAQLDNKNGIKSFNVTNLSLTNTLFSTENFKLHQEENYILTNTIFILLFLFLGFCYFARGNIDDNIKFYNKRIENRLV